jgi:hypothetical protein
MAPGAASGLLLSRQKASVSTLQVALFANGHPSASTTFARTDQLRLHATPPAAGYLYAASRTGSGAWRWIFPSSPNEPDTSRVSPPATYLIPAGAALTSPTAEPVTVLVFFSPSPLDTSLDPTAQPVAPVTISLNFR